MKRRTVDTLAVAANRAADGWHIVCSVGSIDGVMLAALRRVRLRPAAGSTSTWGPGVTQEGDRSNDGTNPHD